MAPLARWVLVLSAMALVLWLRMLPLALSVTDDWADSIVSRRLYHRLAQEVSKELPLAQWQAQVALQATQWLAQHAAQFESERAAVAQRLKSQLRYTGKDGRDYVYLGDFDSYLWLRHARNYLRQGTMCDAIVNGECRDTYANAPVGARMIYQRSLHSTAIAGLHKLITLFRPTYPLSASAFLVPVLIGVLGVPPAFGIGRRLAGHVGGLFAAVFTALSPTLLIRSIGSDNDVWNVVLPLYMMWAAIAAIAAKSPRRQIVYSILAGACAGLHAWTWQGWLFTYAVLVTGLLAQALLHGLRHAMQQRTLRVWQAAAVRQVALVTGVFYAAAGLCTTLAQPEASYLELPFTVWESVWGSGEHAGGADAGGYWPDVLQTVTELVRPNIRGIIQAMGGGLFFFGALLGLVLLVLPQDRWRWQHFVVLCGSLLLYGYIMTEPSVSRLMVVSLLTLPLAGALLLSWDNTAVPDTVAPDVACIVCLWFLGALYLAYGGIRFLLLLEAPCGIACAVAVGRLYTWVRRLAVGAAAWYWIVTAPLLVIVLLLLLIQPVRWGYTTARSYVPHMNDAWWDTLTHIRDASPPDAIVNTWWDYGHWVKYVAERRVSSDGGTLVTHVPHWLGKALVTPSARESLGVLRMLNCASDATPRPEGQQGAYGKLRAAGYDLVTAYAMLEELINLETIEAQEYLGQRGFTLGEQASMLHSTHCVPPASYLILTSALLHSARSWMHLGLWDPRKVDLAQRLRFLSQTEAIGDLMGRFRYTEQEAARLYAQAKASAGGLHSFVGPSQGYLSPQWLSCHATQGHRELVCAIRARLHPIGIVLEDFVYNPTSAAEAKLHLRYPAGQGFADTPAEGAPAVLILAGAQQQEEVTSSWPIHPDIGVLVDLPNQRILVGAPLLLRSTFTHLMYLDGRYTAAFEKFDERTVDTGERVLTWKIHWDGR